MSRASFIPIEIDFILGVDGHRFTGMPCPARIVYLSLWAYAWHNSLSEEITPDILTEAVRLAQIDTRTAAKAMQTCCKFALVEKIDDGWKLLGFNEKRAKAMHRRQPQSGEIAEPERAQSGTKEKEKGNAEAPRKREPYGCDFGWLPRPGGTANGA